MELEELRSAVKMYRKTWVDCINTIFGNKIATLEHFDSVIYNFMIEALQKTKSYYKIDNVLSYYRKYLIFKDRLNGREK